MRLSTLRRLAGGTRLHRIHRPAHDPLFFGPPGAEPQSRFDSPDGRFKILYAARSLETAFAETLVRTPAVPYVLSSAVGLRVRSELVVTRPLKLYPLVDGQISFLGLSFTDLHGDAYARTWDVSDHIHRSTSADGLVYASRFDNQRCVALFDRAASAIEVGPARCVPISPSEAERLSAHFGKIYVDP